MSDESQRETPPPAAPPEGEGGRGEVSLATISLRQVRVSRSEMEDRTQDNPMNRLVPYLDLFGRLADSELSRLATVPTSAVENLRRQVVQVNRALERFADLLPRLSDGELVRLTGATPKTVRFWRLCQPRAQAPARATAVPGEASYSVARAAETMGRVQSSTEASRPGTNPPPYGGAVALSRDGDERHPSGETTRAGTGERRRVSGEDSGSEPLRRHPSGESPGVAPPRRHPSGETPGVAPPRRHPSGETNGPALRRHPSGETNGVHKRRHPSGETPGVAPPRRPLTNEPPPMRPKSQRFQIDEPTGTFEAPSSAALAKAAASASADVQRAASDQMSFQGAPFPNYSGRGVDIPPEEDGIFIGLELPDPIVTDDDED